MQNYMKFRKIRTDILILFAKGLARFPLPVVLGFGQFMGYLFWCIPNKRKKIASRNIELCFPELDEMQRKHLLKQNLISTGRGFSEMVVAFWGRDSQIMPRMHFYGLQHVEDALKQGKGCMLLSCHMHSIELVIRAINSKISKPGHMLARQHNNKIYESYIDQARKKHCQKTIDKKDMKGVLKSLKMNHPVYYVPDQNFSYQFEFIDFFGQPAATVTAPVRLAKSTAIPVIPWFGYYVKNERGEFSWCIEFLEPLEYFHEKDMHESLKKMNLLFEQQIRKHPEQYLWVHRRFKNHPEGRNFVYKDL